MALHNLSAYSMNNGLLPLGWNSVRLLKQKNFGILTKKDSIIVS